MADNYEPSSYSQVTRQIVTQIKEELDSLLRQLHDFRSDVFKEIKELRNRLPVWATLLIALLTSILGYCIGLKH